MRHLCAKFVCKISPEWNNLRKKMFLPKVTFLWNLHFQFFFHGQRRAGPSAGMM